MIYSNIEIKTIIVKGQELARKLSDQLVDNNKCFIFAIKDIDKEEYEFACLYEDIEFVKSIIALNKWLSC